MKDRFSGWLRAYFNKYSLSSRQMEKLNRILAEHPERNGFRKVSGGTWAKVTLAVGVSLTAALLFILYDFYFQGDPYRELAREIAYHHNKKMNLEFTSQSIEDLRNRFNKLDFTLIDSSILSKPELTLLGGRYCSLRGKMGAELKVQNSNTKEIHTFYQLLRPERFPDLKESLVTFENGVKVRIWKEQGLLLAITNL